jgi:HAMP domain-containing protein
MTASIETKKKGSFRRNVIITFVLISLFSLATTGFIALTFVNFIGEGTTSDSSNALETQIQRNMELTSEKVALTINQKLSNAEGLVRAMAEECEYILSSDSSYTPREVYYDYYFEYPQGNQQPADIQYEERYGINVSWNYSSWYIPGSNSTNYQTYYTANAERLDRISNLDYMFKNIHEQAPEFRWLYVGFENSLFINYPGSIVGGSDLERNVPATQFAAATEGWYQDLRSGGRQIVFVGPYYDPIDNVLLISIGRAIYNEFGSVIGIIAGDISVDNIRTKILDVKVLETGFSALVTSYGGIVAHPEVADTEYSSYALDIDDLPPLLDFEEALTESHIDDITSGETGAIEFQREGEDMLLVYTPVGIGGYICMIVVPVVEALRAVPALEARIAEANLQATSLIFTVTIAGIIIAGVVAAVVTRSITRPLVYLMDLALRNVTTMIKEQPLDSVDLQVDTTYTRQDDEIGELARAFQGMLDTIREDET